MFSDKSSLVPRPSSFIQRPRMKLGSLGRGQLNPWPQGIASFPGLQASVGKQSIGRGYSGESAQITPKSNPRATERGFIFARQRTMLQVTLTILEEWRDNLIRKRLCSTPCFLNKTCHNIIDKEAPGYPHLKRTPSWVHSLPQCWRRAGPGRMGRRGRRPKGGSRRTQRGTRTGP